MKLSKKQLEDLRVVYIAVAIVAKADLVTLAFLATKSPTGN
jgi:hypothetical protein